MIKNAEKIDEFSTLIQDLQSTKYHVEYPFDHAVILSPSKDPKTPIDFTVMGITHGNEVVGLDILCSFVKKILDDTVKIDFKLALVLGNVEASLQNKRFVHSDMNRSMGLKAVKNEEEKRGVLISEHVLKHTRYLFDIHQTIEPTKKSFFIFPFTRGSFEFASFLDKNRPVVTHWGKGFSKDGMCTDEFVNRNGGTGISIELGQKGFDDVQTKDGLEIVLRAVNAFNQKTKFDGSEHGVVYTWSEVVSYPEGEVLLNEGIHNFDELKQGENFGVCDGKNLSAATGGVVMFPKYIKSGDPRPKELIRFMRVVNPSELP